MKHKMDCNRLSSVKNPDSRIQFSKITFCLTPTGASRGESMHGWSAAGSTGISCVFVIAFLCGKGTKEGM